MFIDNTWFLENKLFQRMFLWIQLFLIVLTTCEYFSSPAVSWEKKRGNVQLGTSIYDLSRIFGQLMLNAEESFFLFSFIFSTIDMTLIKFLSLSKVAAPDLLQIYCKSNVVAFFHMCHKSAKFLLLRPK